MYKLHIKNNINKVNKLLKIKKHLNENKYINYFKNNKVYHLYNIYHLGDNVFNLIFFYLIKTYIEEQNITIYYYANKEYITQLNEFIYSNNIKLLSNENRPKQAVELWINNSFFNSKHDDAVNLVKPKKIQFNLFYKQFFNSVLQKLNFNYKITKFYYEDLNLISRYNTISEKYKNFDILIVNSTPLSGQFNYNKTEWDNYICNLNKYFKILTTTKVNENILCTFDDNLTIKDIAALSTKAKIIIAINSGVVPGLLNYYTLTNVKKFYIFDVNNTYSYPNFEHKNNINEITINDINKYLTK